MGLRKAIGKKTLMFIVINAILGTGIFFLPALGAVYAGPASILAWVAMSFIAVLIACYFAELVSMFPKSGGIYEYTKIFGKFPSFIVGWLSWIIANITIAMLIVGSLLYLFPSSSMLFYAAASVSAILLFNAVSYMGIKNSARLLLFFGLMTIATLLILILPGSFSVDLAAFSPFVISPLMIFLAMYIISETFFGWESFPSSSRGWPCWKPRRPRPRWNLSRSCRGIASNGTSRGSSPPWLSPTRSGGFNSSGPLAPIAEDTYHEKNSDLQHPVSYETA